jgi:uncharacterized membrane protein
MPSRFPLLSIFLLLFASALCDAQTATCTNWKFFSTGFSTAINRWGTVVGVTASPNHPSWEGFIRYSNGGFTTYNFPNSSQTWFNRRNALGVTVGDYWDSAQTQKLCGACSHNHGFVLSGSTALSVDYPGAHRTLLKGINYWGTIVGVFEDSSGAIDGFKLKNGVLTSVHYPGSTFTAPSSISDKGVIVGTYVDTQGLGHGFVLQNGVYTTLDNPKADPGPGTRVDDINSSGAIVGSYYNGPLAHSFIYINGVFKEIIVPNAIYAGVTGLNGYGDVTGTANFYPANYTYFTARCQ